jgi:hypothetical protein
VDSLDDISFRHFAGNQTDLDGDSTPESRWLEVKDSNDKPYGRFAGKVADENGKVNLNTCDRSTLGSLFSERGAAAPDIDAIFSQRPLNAVEQLGSVIGKSDFSKVKNFVTIYSHDHEVDLDKKRRVYLNTASFRLLLETFVSAGLRNAFDKAVNLKDAADSDLSQSVVDKFSSGNLYPTLTEAGSWTKDWRGEFSAPAGGQAGKFSWSGLSVADGEYNCFLYAPEDTDAIGKVYLEENDQVKELLLSAEGLRRKVKLTSGAFSLYLQPPESQNCRFSYAELVSLEPAEGLNKREVYGTEALVINELMVNLSEEKLLPAPVEIASGDSFAYTFGGIKAGYYYLMLYAASQGQVIGDVTVNGKAAGNLYGGDYFPVSVDAARGAIEVQIKNNTLGKASFRGIKISQQPDGEFVELLSLAPEPLDLSGFSLEVRSLADEPVLGWPAHISEGTIIQPYQHLVLAVDADDSSPAPAKLRNNHTCVGDIWNVAAAGLNFDDYAETIDKTFDLFPDKGGYVILKDTAARQVDIVQYQTGEASPFASLERSDPARHLGGIYNSWRLSDNPKKATPAQANDNLGMYTSENNFAVKHSPSERVVFNRPLADLAEMLRLSDGRNWKNFTVSDLSRLQDHLSLHALKLPLLGHYKSGEFREGAEGFLVSRNGDSGSWEFADVPCGDYSLSIIAGDLNTEGANVKVAYKTESESGFENYAELIFSNGVAFFGKIDLPGEGKTNLEVQVINDSATSLILKELALEPVYSTVGRINVNTAPNEVLRSIFNSESLTQIVLLNRPIGAKDAFKLGVGELFNLDSGFIPFSDLLTVRSDVYEINSRGEYLKNNKTAAFQAIRTVIERVE